MNDVTSTMIFIYFIYGLVFFTLGISALMHINRKHKAFPLVNSIQYLGLFGLLHGIVEWLIMFSFTTLFSNHFVFFRELIWILNGLSFIFLLFFALKLMNHYVFKKDLRVLFIFTSLIGLGIYISTFFIGDRNMMIRYFIGFPSAFMTGLALFLTTQDHYYSKMKWMRYQLNIMAGVFVLYGLTQLMDQSVFLNLLGIRLEVSRTLLAIIITLLFVSVIRLFKLENDKRLNHLIARQNVAKERKRLAREMHDVILQDLFSVGIQIENLQDAYSSDTKLSQKLSDSKVQLNTVMERIRDFLNTSSFEKNDVDDLYVRLQTMLMNFKTPDGMAIKLSINNDQVNYGFISTNKLNQLYYVVRESVINANKHSQGTFIQIGIDSTITGLRLTIFDDGKGFDTSKPNALQGMGLKSMLERINMISGEINIRSDVNGTRISIIVPWEV
ncbi:sensor histidine kinase [Petrocella sp. FN5]|uniref:sensor histidine kinase n=1 Tax=Petrocella sp. FN5 TaxID=3032002 RepID=UPI0023D9F879|nr:histidine kinase [Petrocella sp. FN5]MDF1618702.1 histidine kinase [Petrocella sp. FN5]